MQTITKWHIEVKGFLIRAQTGMFMYSLRCLKLFVASQPQHVTPLGAPCFGSFPHGETPANKYIYFASLM
jgi:hypothetical protein